MARKKARPIRVTQSDGSSEYLGTFSEIAANSQNLPLAQIAPNNQNVARAERQEQDTGRRSTVLEPPSEEPNGEASTVSKNVRFADEVATIPAEPDPIPPEIEFITDEEEAGCKKSVLRYNFHPTHMVEETDETAIITLWKFALDTSVHVEINAPQDNTMPDYCIRTKEGATELVKICGQLAGDTEVAELKHVGLAVEHQMLRLTIGQDDSREGNTIHSITLSLTNHAFAMCNPRHLHVQANKNSKVYRASLTLQRALAELSPGHSEKFPLAQEQRSESHSITAKQVYALVDNLQLKAYLSKKQPPTPKNGGDQNSEVGQPMKIPGLVPTLRPYQEAAVKWMLQREKLESPLSGSGEEWELAWIIVDVGKSDSRSAKWRVKYLTDYRKHLPTKERRKESPHQFLFCPFTNWLARSVEEAKEMTLRSGAESQAQEKISSARGGILADSMGLGKTVEVLACILSNPDPLHSKDKMEAAKNMVSLSSTVSLSSSESQSVSAAVSAGANQEQDTPSHHDGRKKTRKRGRSSSRNAKTRGSQPPTNSQRKHDVTTGRVSPSDSSLSASDNEGRPIITKPSNLEERWFDLKDCELGSCICGRSISVFPSPEIDSIVLCEGCQEPMHWKCAAFGSEREQLSRLDNGIIYRRYLSNDSFWCRFCPASYCPCCVANGVSLQPNSKFRSRGTVIVTPPAILGQWEREVSHHTLGSLKVVVYHGMRNLIGQQQGKGEESCLLHPRFLADADIVLMTFDALHQDLGHSSSNPFAGNGRASLRKRKRYRVVPSPLSSITWWRVCLDEAQRVETPTVGSAQMALKLDTQHRWCVSGTPVGRGKLDDLFGLLLFLRLTAPFNNKHWFRQCFSSFPNDAYMQKRLRHLLASVFWRSTKKLPCVQRQIGVLPQIEKRAVLKFSSVEKHFYSKLCSETMQIVCDLDGSKKLSAKKRKGDKNMEVLERQLGRLRAACCHPQVGSNGLALEKKSGGVKVLSMDQILDRLIDEAKNKCEEALRVALFHSNPMATLSRLKVEARRDHGVSTISQSDKFLFAQSCKLYQDAISLADENAAPSLVTEEVLMSGSTGFRTSGQKVRGGAIILSWQLQLPASARDKDQSGSHPWACLEYEGQGKKMRQIRVKALSAIPLGLAVPSESVTWRLRRPRHLSLQVSNAAVGGEFVDVLSIELPKPQAGRDPKNEWVEHLALPIYKSKMWRIMVQSFYPAEASHLKLDDADVVIDNRPKGDYAGLEVELYEPTIGFDSLQRLHTLHNAAISLRHLQGVQSDNQSTEHETSPLPCQLSTSEISKRLASMETESSKIEAYNLEYARNVRMECSRRLRSLITERQSVEQTLPGLSKRKGFWDVAWWDDIVAAVKLYGSPEEQHSLCEKVQEAVDGCDTHYDNEGKGDGAWYRHFLSPQDAPELPKFQKPKASNPFPKFRDLHGLAVAMKVRFDDDEFLAGMQDGGYHKCIMSVLELSPNPTNQELLENKHCGRCKADWGQTGPLCSHCKVEEKLVPLHFDNLKLARFVFQAIWKWAKSNRSGVRSSSSIRKSVEQGSKFFEIMEIAKREVISAYRLWSQHLQLLNVMDELNSTKTPMRLVHEDDNLILLTEEQRGALVNPVDVCAKFHDHEAKQAMALANLRQEKHNLTFLKNQVTQQSKSESCIVCLSAFTGDRAVLACGHSFHPPCLDFLKGIQKNSSHIRCPLRCKKRSKDVMIASDRRTDDGTKSARAVKGDYGTKVNALVGDLLGVSQEGEKSVVFSMWEDMLDIVEKALFENGIKFVRASGLSKIGESTKRFRSSDCFVLLLNVKNGAEGLNLIEATHVFMIEPLLNCGLDSQAIARVHRIGQTEQTYVHRYLVEDTVEMNIDKYRQEHQEDQLEDAITDGRKCAIQAGGIDGGFKSKEELLEMLQLPQK